LASIGVHKNGTWAAQKIIDYSNTPEQVNAKQKKKDKRINTSLLGSNY
jgi:phosphoribosylaminoimidazole (AIR) synthetase